MGSEDPGALLVPPRSRRGSALFSPTTVASELQKKLTLEEAVRVLNSWARESACRWRACEEALERVVVPKLALGVGDLVLASSSGSAPCRRAAPGRKPQTARLLGSECARAPCHLVLLRRHAVLSAR